MSIKERLPEQFVNQMKNLLKEDYDSFIASYDHQRVYGLRVNELKISTQDWLQQAGNLSNADPIPWCRTGFNYKEEDRPGKHPHYHSGLYYIQEPSAMVPVELLDVAPGHRVLDLCAAPGGKSTQIASKLQGHGVLVSNDIATERTKPLVKNIELAGVRNAVVLNEHPAKIAQVFTGWFDRILIDAPCSGEGMFRKKPSMIDEWGEFSIDRCADMQREILDEIARMLAPGGRMVYSTCTFSPQENEEQIARFLIRHPEFSVIPIEPQWGWAHGQPQWITEHLKTELSKEQYESLAGTIRIWPHRSKGEGHFVAVLQRAGDAYIPPSSWQEDNAARIEWPTAELVQIGSKNDRTHGRLGKNNAARHSTLNVEDMWKTFAAEHVQLCGDGQYKAVMIGSKICLQPYEVPSLQGLKVARAGWRIGEIKNGKFVPYHPLAMAIKQGEALRSVSFSSSDEQLIRYLKGETIFVDKTLLKLAEGVKLNGYVLICVDQFPVGFGKYMDGMIKNELPAGWRLI